MRTRKKQLGRHRLLLLALCVLLVLGLVLGIAAIAAKLSHYSENATVTTPLPDPEPEVQAPPPPEEDPYADWPKNEYDPAKFYIQNDFTRYAGPPIGKVGVDVSAHQADIDWAAVKADGVEFAMIRVGYRGYTKGDIELDEYFAANIQSALEAGLQVGVYFFSQAISVEEAVEEAEFVLEQIEPYAITYPVVFDWEDIEAEARTDNMDMITLTTCADEFCKAVEAKGYTAGVYFNQRFGYQELNLLSLSKYVLWLAEYNPRPSFRFHFDMWQYSCTGTVEGIGTDVDLNLSFWSPDGGE